MTAERPTGDLGRKLREARERKGMSLRQIANSTKIALSVLDAIERNDISKLPGGIFGRAFVRSFATEVGLDPETTIQEFIAQFRDESVAAGHPPSEQIEDNEALESNRRMASTFIGLIVLSIPVAAAITYFGFAERREPPAVVERRAQATTPAPAETVPAPAAPVDVVLDTAREAAAANRLVVTLAATRPCWVLATVDGQRQFERIMSAGENRTIEVPGELKLEVGDAGALAMTINGVAARPLGTAGKVLTITLNSGNAKTYLAQ